MLEQQAALGGAIAAAVPWHLRPCPTFLPTGNTDFIRRLKKGGFEERLAVLLQKANYRGMFTYRGLEPVKGSSHTHGLKVKRPARFGVELTYHHGSNDNNILVIVLPPKGVLPQEFFLSLQRAEEIPDEKVPDYRANGHGGRVLPALPEEKKEEPPQVAAKKNPVRRLDDTMVEQIMLEMAVRADEDGTFLYSELTTYLVDTLNFERPQGAGPGKIGGKAGYAPAIGLLINRRHILRVDGDNSRRRLGIRWRRDLLNQDPVDATEHTEEVQPRANLESSDSEASVEQRFAQLKELAKQSGASEISAGVFVMPAREELVALPEEKRLAELMTILDKKKKQMDRYRSLSEQHQELWALRNTLDEQQRVLVELAEASVRMSATMAAFEKRYADNIAKLKATLEKPEYQGVEEEFEALKKKTFGS